MKRERALAILAEPVEALSIAYLASGPVIKGRLLEFEGMKFALGRFVAEGDEAIVHELIDVNSGARNHVLKICRHPPKSTKYVEWAVPFRVEGNELSRLADVELNTAKMIWVSGTWIKVQNFFAGPNKVDWTSKRTVEVLLLQLAKLEPEAALARVTAVRQRYGPQVLLFEAEAFAHARAERWEQAEVALKKAVATYRHAKSSLVLGSLLQLADVYKELYRKFENPGATTMSFKLEDGTIVKQQLFSDPAASALDDEIQDRSCFSLLEALGEEPLLVPALLGVAEDFADHLGSLALAMAERAKAINPAVPGLDAFIDQMRARASADSGTHATDAALQLADPSMPEGLAEHMARWNAAYQPDSAVAWTGKGRELAFKGFMMQGAYEKALEVAEQWCTIDDGASDGRIATVRALTKLGRHDEAETLGDSLLAEFPERVEVLDALYELYVARDEHERALRYALMILNSGDEYARQGALMVSRAYRRMGTFEKAERYAKLALAEDFSDRDYVLNYVYLLREMGRHRDTDALIRERALIARALEAQPRSTDFMFCHAQSLGLSGRVGEITQVLREILEIEPGHGPAQQFLQALKNPQE